MVAKEGQITCTKCFEKRTRILGKLGRSDGRKIYVDQNGKRWLGWTCPPCTQTARVKYDKVKSRKCRHCNKLLSASRYFDCINCKPVLDENMDINESYMAW